MAALVVFVQGGDAIDYTPESAVAAGDVIVQEDLVGVAKRAIAAGALGALHVSGVFDFPKDAGSAGEALSGGEKVYWDEDAEVATATAEGNTYLGKVVFDGDAAEEDETVRVRMSQ